MDSFVFTPAIRESTPVVIGIAGPSGGGKTYTCLELAMGLRGEGKIALIDTEGKRSLYFADLLADETRPDLPFGSRVFEFDRCGLEAPYTPARFLDAMKQAQAAGYAVVIVDSYSDSYIGEGGLVDMAAAQKVPNEAAKWAVPKAQNKLVVRWIRNSARCHLLFAMRAEEKVKLVKIVKDGREQTVVEPQGFQPICEKAFMFELMESCLLTPDARGVPKWIKPLQQHLKFFPEGKPITRESGRLLAEWCAGGAAPIIAPAPADEALIAAAWDAARGGMVALEAFWRSPAMNGHRTPMKALLDDELKPAAHEADAEIGFPDVTGAHDDIPISGAEYASA